MHIYIYEYICICTIYIYISQLKQLADLQGSYSLSKGGALFLAPIGSPGPAPPWFPRQSTPN